MRNAGYSLATQLLTSAFTAGLTLFLARHLGLDRYGILALAMGVGALVVLPVDFGVSSSVMRFVAANRTDPAAVRSFLADGLRLKVLLTIPACAALVALAGPIAWAYGTPGLAWPLRGIALAVFGQSLLTLYQGTFAALGLIRLQLRAQAAESVVETGASVLLVLLGGGASGAAFGRGIGYAVGALFAVAVTSRAVGGGILPRRRGGGNTRTIARYAGPLLIINSAYALFEQIDILIIGAVISAAKVGLFQAPLRLATFLYYPGAAVANAVAPRLVGGDDEGASRAHFHASLRGLILVDAALVPPLLIWAGPIVRLTLGPDYAGSVPVLRALAPFVFLQGLGPLVSLALSYLGDARGRVLVAIGAVAVNAAIDAVLVPSIGIVGGAIGSDVALALYVGAHLQMCRRHLDVRLAPLALTTLRALVAGTGMAAVLALAGTGHLTPLGWIVGGAGGLAAYVGILVVTGELRADDARAVTARLPGRRTGTAT